MRRELLANKSANPWFVSGKSTHRESSGWASTDPPLGNLPDRRNRSRLANHVVKRVWPVFLGERRSVGSVLCCHDLSSFVVPI